MSVCGSLGRKPPGNEEGEQVGSLDLVGCDCDCFVPAGLHHW